MSIKEYIACDGCGTMDINPADEPWQRQKSGWCSISYVKDYDYVTEDFCPVCANKITEFVKNLYKG